MALSDSILQNIPTQKDQKMLRVFNPETREMEWITSDMFDPERHQRFPGNLNTAEEEMLNQIKLSDESIRSRLGQKAIQSLMDSGDPQIREMISSLMSAGVPIEDIVKQVQQYIQNSESIMSPDKGTFEPRPHSEGSYFRKFNKGGIVSLKHLTRPLGY